MTSDIGTCACLYPEFRNLFINLIRDRIGTGEQLSKKIQETPEQERIVEYGTLWKDHIRVITILNDQLKASLKSVEAMPECKTWIR